MPRVFLLLSDDGPTGAATQARLALAHLPAWDADSAHATVRHAFDFTALIALRARIARFRPDVLHAVGAGAARAASLLKLPRVGLRPFPRLVLSGCDAADGWLARRALARADAVLAYSPGEAERYAKSVRDARIRRIPPGMAFLSHDPGGRENRTWGAIIAVGNYDRWSGLKTAIWAFDLLKYLSPELRLHLIGDGPGRATVERFGRAVGADDCRLEFVGRRADVPARVATAQLAWVTHERGGVSVVLEAMTAGTPVVAIRTPDTESVVRDGETGVLVPAGDRVAMASATAALLARPDEWARLGEAARRAAAARFPVRDLANATAAVYDA